MPNADQPQRLRIDKWLWHARLVKTRSLAQRLCEAGQVAVASTTVQRAAHAVSAGDTIMLTHAGIRHRVQVLALGDRRGPAPEARLLYAELAPPERLPRGDPSWQTLLDED